jgi:capsular exopolysaccharide synthesis family protein
VELRQYLDIFKRHRWFLIEMVVVVGVLAGVLSALRTPIYQGTAQVLLRPNDPTEQLDPSETPRALSSDPNRYVAAQRQIAESEAVARAASKNLPGLSPKQVMHKASAHQRGASDVLEIKAVDPGPARARDVANEVARAYIENRRLSAVAGLDKAITDIEDRLADLQTRIAELDTKIAASPAAGSSSLTRPVTPSTQAPTNPTAAPAGTGLDSGGQPTGRASLEAARYAAAVQYESLFARQQDLLVEKNLKRGEAELIALAETPGEPVSPKPVRDGILGGLIGLLLGMGLALLREQLDDRVRSTTEAERVTGLPVLAQVPFDEEVAKAPSQLAVLERPHGPLSEALRSLRTSIQFVAVDEPVKTIVITSAGPGDGKSLVAANLAAVYAQAGYRTLLVSADLRRPRIDSLFPAAKGSPGLTGVIADLSRNGNSPAAAATHLSQAVVRTDLPNLVLLPAGVTPPNPAEILNSRRMHELLAAAAAQHDIIVIDTPPLLAVTDAAVLAARADGVALVAALGETHRDAAHRSVGILAGANARVLGIVVNKAEAGRGAYTSYYGYAAPAPKRGRRRRARQEEAVAALEGEAIPVTPGHAGREPRDPAAVPAPHPEPPPAAPRRSEPAQAPAGFLTRRRHGLSKDND